ncbi:nuclease-related domain-containing protein [Blastococcus sp. SYSU D01042]
MDPLRAVAAAAARVHTWAASTEARRRTQRLLNPLRDAGWDVTHDLRIPGIEPVDHLVAGPSGVYVLVSKAWHGVVTVDQKGATITPERDPGSAWTARGPHRSLPPAASAVARALAASGRRPVPAPQAVVVVWAPFPERAAGSGGLCYVAGEHLVEWLVGRPARPAPTAPAALPLPPAPARAPHRAVLWAAAH